MAAKKKASTVRKQKAKATTDSAKKKLQDRVAAAAAAVAEAKADVDLTKKRQNIFFRMAERKEIAVAKFVESWTKKEMAKIELALKPKRRKSR